MKWYQKTIKLKVRPRGFHWITDEVLQQVDELRFYKVGLFHLFIRHTSASLTINESADPSVKLDMESHFNVMVPEGANYYRHVDEGADDMPAHLKHSLLGSSVSVPINNGQLLLGVWQGIYLCEHRDRAGPRELVITIQGDHAD
ncbi:MAG: secondary thiamine-phosphate synthase enzyme YjbQ [Pseudomonadales bacterium]|nr:secondary thiamine-phosphate synthase enzyme YjbQ [Pseudomonadales bacterium]